MKEGRLWVRLEAEGPRGSCKAVVAWHRMRRALLDVRVLLRLRMKMMKAGDNTTNEFKTINSMQNQDVMKTQAIFDNGSKPPPTTTNKKGIGIETILFE